MSIENINNEHQAACSGADDCFDDGIRLCSDNKYRWIYEMSLFKNLGILLLIWKIFFLIFVGMWFCITLISSSDPGFWWGGFFGLTKGFAALTAFFMLLIVLAYAIYAFIMGGKLCVLFTMDEIGVIHQQQELQRKKAERLAEITALMGAMTTSPTVIGIGINSSRYSMTSNFKNVKSLIAVPHRNIIYVNETFAKNQIYVRNEDFDFVWEYISSRCIKAKIKRK